MRIPDYTRQKEFSSVKLAKPTSPAVVPDAFGGGENAAVVSKALSTIAEHAKQMAIDEQDKEVLNRETSFRKEMQDRLFSGEDEIVNINGKDVSRKKGLLLRQLEDAKGIGTEFDKYYNEGVKNKYLAGLSQYQLEKLTPAIDSHFLTLRDNVFTHEANQWDEAFKNATEANATQKINDASAIRDPIKLSEAIDDVVKTAEPYNKKYDEATRKLLNEDIAKKVTASALNSMLDNGETEEALTLLQGVKDKFPEKSYIELKKDIADRVDIIKKNRERDLRIAEKELKIKQDANFTGLLTKAFNNELNLKEAEQSFSANDISYEDYSKLESYLTSFKSVDAETNLKTYEEIRELQDEGELSQNAIEGLIIDAVSKGKLKEDDGKSLMKMEQNLKDAKLKSLIKVERDGLKAWADKHIGGKYTLETMEGLQKGQIENLLYEFDRRVNEENAKGERIEEIKREIISEYVYSSDSLTPITIPPLHKDERKNTEQKKSEATERRLKELIIDKKMKKEDAFEQLINEGY